MAPRPRAVPRADPAGRRRARRRDDRPAALLPGPARRGPAPPPQARRRRRPGRGAAADREAQADLAARPAGLDDSWRPRSTWPPASPRRPRSGSATARARHGRHHGGAVAAGRRGRGASACSRRPSGFYRRAADEPPPERGGPPEPGPPGPLPRPPRPAQGGRRPLREASGPTRGRRPRARWPTSASMMLCNPATPVDAAQIRRVVGWFEKAGAENPRPLSYLVGLGNLYERLGDYPRAEDVYRKAIRINDRDGIASNNLAWLIVLRGGRTERGPRPDQQRHPGQGAAAGVPRHPGHDLPEDGRPRTACRPPTSRRPSRPPPRPPKYFHLAQAYLQPTRRRRPAGPSRPARPGGCPAASIPWSRTSTRKWPASWG